ncbi:MAG: PQQ-binding-like beta-propeller repeat protein [Thermoplasmata archaeon]|nr:PQQ-binding-like beta-propeller repeat protein [Thermoplasmata archaeon]
MATNPAAGNWTTYHGDATRSGDEPMSGITAAHTAWAAPSILDGQVYAEPLVCGNSVFVATENDSVYAVNATTGNVLWRTHLGTPIPGSILPCGNIDPSGITGTPVIDRTSSTIYVVAFLGTTEHVLFGLNLSDGTIRSRVVVDPIGANPVVEQERGALALANGVVYIPFGGLDGDCGQYHGWVVGVRTDGTGGLLSYQVPTGREGGIWSPAGIAVGANGDLYVATGNSAATTTFDYGDAVIQLSPALQVLSYFAPTNWAQLNSGDVDLGSVAPTLLPNGDLFQIGKEGVGYVLSGSNLGGIGGQIYSSNVCSGAFAGTAHVADSVLTACVDGIFKVVVGTSSFSVAWSSSSFDAGAPIVTGDVVWGIDTSSATLLGLNFSTGLQMFSFPLGTVGHFCTPAAAPGRVYVAAGDQLSSFSLS